MRSSYTTVGEYHEHEVVIKGSRFISCILPCGSESDLEDGLSSVKERYPNATHYCYAARFSGNERFSDNGEPSGTAGRPMMQVVRGSGIDDIMAVTVRYFGGTLLGTGGLVQAYSDTTSDAISSVRPVRMVLCEKLAFDCSYQEYNRFLSECGKYVLGRPEQSFSDVVNLISDVPSDSKEGFVRMVNDITRGNVQIRSLGSCYARDV